MRLDTSNNRSKNLKKNIIYSVGLKALGVLLSFMLLPLTVHYLSEVEYGIWVTLFSVMNWINMLDMGIGLGLRNKLAEAVAREDLLEIRAYISTGVWTMMCLGTIFFVVFHIVMSTVNMQKLFNTTAVTEQVLYEVTYWTGIFVILAFVLSVINQIYYAYQKAAMVGGIGIVHSLVMLVVVYYLTLQPSHRLIYFVFAFGVAMISSRLAFIGYFFHCQWKVFPWLKYFQFNKVRSISNLGIKFFIIQICCIFGFTFNNLLITEFLGPEYVRTFDIISKVMGFSFVLQNLAMTPLWSAYTEAYVRHDYLWIGRVFRKSLYLTVGIIMGFLVVALFIDQVIYLWMHIRLEYSNLLLGLIGFYYVEIMFCNVSCMLLNGIGDINIQMLTWILTAVSVIPFTYYWSLMANMGLEGIALGMTLSLVWLDVILPLQIFKIFRKWNDKMLVELGEE
ncbi:lipopolysaccharide biosynthesis protein [Selenomonas ruminantium]|uniref:Na+-driven multidrug efflux pump n=1 Tax=Selenomonas ruminantium TaxID=971 RepID=A0A1H0M738_SELRU|nr:MATE family efflux transporter [Selenomonas ruminantium]SDO76155.1 Na+-driven multidrug efflux pump [Selenomonas ruminantium]